MEKFQGYRIKSTNTRHVEKVLLKAKDAMQLAANDEYNRMLSETVCEVFDDIALNIAQRPDGPLLDEAVARLNQRINMAESTNNGTEFSFRASVSIIPDKDYTYLMLNVTNPALQAAFAGTEGIESFTVEDDEDLQMGIRSAAAVKWEELRTSRADKPVILSAFLGVKVAVDKTKLKWESPLNRAQTRARRQLLAQYMNQYACWQTIESNALMPVLERALLRLSTEEGCYAEKMLVGELARRLPPIEDDLIFLSRAELEAKRAAEAAEAADAAEAVDTGDEPDENAEESEDK